MTDTEDLNELIHKIVAKEVRRLADIPEMTFVDTKQLELYARILNSKAKQDKQSTFGNMSTEELLKIASLAADEDPIDIAKNAPLAEDDDAF